MKDRTDLEWLRALVREVRQIKKLPCGHSFKRRHSYLRRHRGCRKFGVGSHNGKAC